GSRQGRRRLRDGVPDVAVVSGPSDRDIDAVDIGGWTREWGLVVPAENPDGIEGLADLVDRDLRFSNRSTDSGLRASLDAALDDLAEKRGVDRRDLTDAIDGYGLTVKGFESPARTVLAGDAAAGLGLRATADALDCGFVTLGTESVRVLANPTRTDKPGVESLRSVIDTHLDDVVSALAGLDA
ncbi:MAG: substrate-binding domain-containing protein, partial [Haloplanus sp.]